MADSGWVAPSLGNAWAAVAGYTVGYRLIGNLLKMRGAIETGSGVAFTLPSGYFPTVDPLYTVAATDLSGGGYYVQISGSTGTVTPSGYSTGLCLDSVTLWVD